MKSNYLIASLIWIFIFTSISSGEVFRLKNGIILQGSITHDNKDYISFINISFINISFINSAVSMEITLRHAEISNIVKEAAFDKVIDFGQLSKLNNDDWKKLEDKSKLLEAKNTEPEKTKSFTEKYQPRIGLLAGYLLPKGQIASAVKPGLTYGLLFDIHMPIEFMERHGIDWRLGLLGNYAKLSSSGHAAPADLTLIPALLNNELGFQTESGLRPYLKLDYGLTMARLKDKSGNSNISSKDITVMAGLGAGYRNQRLPMLELFLEAAFMRVFEQANGDFIILSFGVSYHLFTKKEDSNETE